MVCFGRVAGLFRDICRDVLKGDEAHGGRTRGTYFDRRVKCTSTVLVIAISRACLNNKSTCRSPTSQMMRQTWAGEWGVAASGALPVHPAAANDVVR